MGMDVAEARVDIADALRVGRGVGLCEQCRAFGVSRQHPVNQRDIAARRFLLHVADAGVRAAA